MKFNEKIAEIKRQKEEYLIPENIRQGVEILGVSGGIDKIVSQEYYTQLNPQLRIIKVHNTYNSSYYDFYDIDYYYVWDPATYIMTRTDKNNNVVSIDFTQIIQNLQTDSGLTYSNYAIGKKEGIYRYVYFTFCNNTNGNIKVAIIKCNFINGSISIERDINYLYKYQDYYDRAVQQIAILPNMYSLDSFAICIRISGGSYRYSFDKKVCTYYNNTLYVGSSYRAYESDGGNAGFESNEKFISGCMFNDENRNVTVIYESHITRIGGIIMSVTSDNTKCLMMDTSNNIYTANLDITQLTSSAIITNKQQITKPSGSFYYYKYVAYTGGISSIIYVANNTYYGMYDFNLLDWNNINSDSNIVNAQYNAVRNLDYSDNLFISNNKIYRVAIEGTNVLTGVEYKNNDLYTTQNLDNVATANQILLGKNAVINSGIVQGTMSNNGTLDYTPITSSQNIPAGYTSGGTISAVDNTIDSNIIAENIKDGVTILGITGNYVGSVIKEYSSVSDMNDDIANIEEGEVVKVINNNVTTIYLKETTMKELVKVEDTMSPAEYQNALSTTEIILGEEDNS